MQTITYSDAIHIGQTNKLVQNFCKNCVFAKFAINYNGGISQTGCEAERLSLLEQNGGELLNITYDNKDEYFLINHRVCNMCRYPAWKMEKERRGCTELVKEARQEIELKATAIIYLGYEQTIENAIYSMENLQKQTIQPSSAIIVNTNANYNPKAILEKVREKKFTMPWSLEYVVETQNKEVYKILQGTNQEEKDKLFKDIYYRCMDVGIKKCKTMYYFIVIAGEVLRTDYIKKIDHHLNDKLERIIAVLPLNFDKENGLFIQRKIHEKLLGNKGQCIIDKIQDQAKEQECQSMVKKWHEIFD